MNKNNDNFDWANWYLGELLAIIHRDGGHHKAKHGLKKSTEDAIEEVNETRKKLSSLQYEMSKTNSHFDEQFRTIQKLKSEVAATDELAQLKEERDEARKAASWAWAKLQMQRDGIEFDYDKSIILANEFAKDEGWDCYES